MIMKKTIFGAAVVALIAPTMLATSVHADDARTLTTTAKVTFTGNPVTPVTPVDPNSPDKPVDPSKPVNPDNPVNPNKPDSTGLYLITAPNFNFGEYDLSKGTSMSVNPTKDDNNPYGVYSAQVSDTRTGGKGWTLTVSNDQFANKDGQKITGAVLSLDKPAVYNSAQSDPSKAVTGNSAYTGTAANLSGDGNGTTVMSVASGQDQGNLTTSINWSPENVTLKAPVANVVTGQTYTSNLTWTLAAAQ